LSFIGAQPGVFSEAISLVGISNLVPSGVTATSAVLSADFRGTDSVFYVSAYWGPTNAGTNVFNWSNSTFVGAFTNVGLANLNLPVTNLNSNTVYYYTFRATNCATDLWATSFNFRTVAPPLVNNGPGPTSIGIGTATLNGNLVGGGQGTTRIYWGDTDGGTNAMIWSNNILVALNMFEGPFSVGVSNLTFGVPYYYRAFASNQFGSAWASTTEVFKSSIPLNFDQPGLNVRVYDTQFGAGLLNPIANLFAAAEDGTHLLQGVLDFNNFGDLQGAYPELTADTQYSVLWDGAMYIDDSNAGWHSFGTASDDGSMVYIDLNQDGDFAVVGGGGVVAGSTVREREWLWKVE
ncbi:MAG: hypothetical protein AAF492_32405, partial [Verrucomicrobiota bacterium]